MKKRTIWCKLPNNKYRSFEGHIFKGGLFGSYNWDGGGWVNHHIPTGLSIFGESKYLKDVREGSARLMTVDCIDWYETDEHILGRQASSVKDYLLAVFHGLITVEEFNVRVMEEKFNGN